MAIIKEFNLFELDEDSGEVSPMGSTRVYKGSPLGKGWFIVYDKAIDALLEREAPYTAWKLYFKLIRMHDYGTELRCQKKYLIKELGVTPTAFYNALRWLKENNFVTETTVMGQGAFVLNPDLAGRGSKSVKTRRGLWSLSPK